MFGNDGSDGVYSFVPGQTICGKAIHCTNNRLKVFGQLVFHDCMKDGVSL